MKGIHVPARLSESPSRAAPPATTEDPAATSTRPEIYARSARGATRSMRGSFERPRCRRRLMPHGSKADARPADRREDVDAAGSYGSIGDARMPRWWRSSSRATASVEPPVLGRHHRARRQ